jgi:hypothetical protein
MYGVAAVLSLAAVMALELKYKNHQLDYANFMINAESNAPTWVADKFSYGRLLDLTVYTVEALLLILVSTRVGPGSLETEHCPTEPLTSYREARG